MIEKTISIFLASRDRRCCGNCIVLWYLPVLLCSCGIAFITYLVASALTCFRPFVLVCSRANNVLMSLCALACSHVSVFVDVRMSYVLQYSLLRLCDSIVLWFCAHLCLYADDSDSKAVYTTASAQQGLSGEDDFTGFC